MVTMWAGETFTEKNGHHFKNVSHFDQILFHVHILRAYVPTSGRHEFSIIKPVAMKTVHRWWCWMTTTTTFEDNTRQTIHDYMGSLAFMPNEPTTVQKKLYRISSELATMNMCIITLLFAPKALGLSHIICGLIFDDKVGAQICSIPNYF